MNVVDAIALQLHMDGNRLDEMVSNSQVASLAYRLDEIAVLFAAVAVVVVVVVFVV